MKFEIQRDILVSLIGKIQGVVPSKAVIPILANVLIEVKDRKLILTATDLTVSLRLFAEVNTFEDGSIVLPARKLFQLIRELITPEVTFSSDSSGVCVITSGSSHFRLKGLESAEFPSFPDLSEGKTFSMESNKLKELLAKSSFAAAKDDSRQVLNGVYLEILDGKATLVGTDGKRLAKVERRIDTDIHEKRGCIIPLKAVEEMIRILDKEENVSITLMQDKIALESRDLCMISKLLSGQFPDYERVVPNHEEMKKITLHKDELITLLKQVSLFTSEASHSVKLSFNKGELRLQGVSSELGEGKVNMPVDYSAEPLEIAFNPFFLIDILRHCEDETVDFGITDSFNPGSITDSSESHFVLMPMRLSTE